MALNKTARQFPKTCEGFAGEAWLAVDGDITTEFGTIPNIRCTCSHGRPNSWSVDLGGSYPLQRIKIFQRNTCK